MRHRMRFRGVLKDQWASLVKSSVNGGKVQSISGQHFILSLSSGDGQNRRFFRIGCAQDRYGRFKPTEVFQELSVLVGDPNRTFEGLVLCFAYQDYVVPYTAWPVPLSHSDTGCVREFIEDEVSAWYSRFSRAETSILSVIADNGFNRLDVFRVVGVSRTVITEKTAATPTPLPADAPAIADAESDDDDIGMGVVAPGFTRLFGQQANAEPTEHAANGGNDQCDDGDVLSRWLGEFMDDRVASEDDRHVMEEEQFWDEVEQQISTAVADENAADPTVEDENAADPADIPASNASDPNEFRPTFEGIDDLDNLMASHGLALISTSAKALFVADISDPSQPIGIIHIISRTAGTTSMKATCKRRHDRCVCWVTQCISGENRFRLLSDYVLWLGGGRDQSGAEHASSAKETNIKWGMRPR